MSIGANSPDLPVIRGSVVQNYLRLVGIARQGILINLVYNRITKIKFTRHYQLIAISPGYGTPLEYRSYGHTNSTSLGALLPGGDDVTAKSGGKRPPF